MLRQKLLLVDVDLLTSKPLWGNYYCLITINLAVGVLQDIMIQA